MAIGGERTAGASIHLTAMPGDDDPYPRWIEFVDHAQRPTARGASRSNACRPARPPSTASPNLGRVRAVTQQAYADVEGGRTARGVALGGAGRPVVGCLAVPEGSAPVDWSFGTIPPKLGPVPGRPAPGARPGGQGRMVPAMVAVEGRAGLPTIPEAPRLRGQAGRLVPHRRRGGRHLQPVDPGPRAARRGALRNGRRIARRQLSPRSRSRRRPGAGATSRPTSARSCSGRRGGSIPARRRRRSRPGP